MLEEVFQDVYTKFKLHFYQNVLQNQRSYVMRILVQRRSAKLKSGIFR